MVERQRFIVMDDVEADRLLAARELRREFPDSDIVEVCNANDFDSTLAHGFDAVVTDYDLHWTNGLDVIRRVQAHNREIPVIMFTGSGNQEIAVEAMKIGAADYVVKSASNYPRLKFAVRNALERSMQWKSLRESEKLAVVGRMMATIAHEINNPLEAISNALYLLEQDPDRTDRSQILALARQELAGVEQITSRTLGFYRETPHPIVVDVSEIVRDTLVLYGGRIRHQAIKVDQCGDGAKVRTYPGELRQVFSNIIGNALDAMPRGGTLRVRTETKSADVNITVADTGHGISEENLGKIFMPFFTTKGERGTGLGMWVVEGIVNKLGGTIRVDSSTAVGQSGTRVHLTFPTRAELAA